MPTSTPPPNADRIAAQLRQAHEKLAGSMGGEGASRQVMSGFAEAYRAWLEAMSAKPETMMDLQGRYMQEQMRLWMNSMQPASSEPEASSADKRFSGKEWSELPVFRYFRDSYLLTSKMMMQAVEEASLDAPTKQRMRFFMRQYLDAAAPSNYLMTNPEALKAAIESRGQTLQEGMKNLLADMEKGRISMTDESAFEVGRNIAVTPGSVVFQSELLQLIQYVPTTARVHERPLVMVPPCIHKYYLMDLQPENSLVKYAVEQGHTVFMVSWRNVKQKQAKKTWDDYIAELIEALEEARRITKTDRINALGFCIGGTLIACALAVLEKRRKDFVVSLTLLTSLLEFSEVGEIRVYIDVTFVLGASGHIAGTINPASKNKRSYWMNDKLGADAEKWFVAARELPGSWWSVWSKWLRPHGGKLVPARKKLGGGRRKPIEPAPGKYAKERL